MINCVLTAGHHPVDMRHFPNRDLAPSAIDRAKLSECDVYIGLFGLRWGSECASHPGRSYTEEEYEIAGELGIPRRLFLLDEASLHLGIPPDQLGYTESTFANQQAFRARVRQQVSTLVASPADLGEKLAQTLADLYTQTSAAVANLAPPDTAPPTRPARTTIPARVGLPFVGREPQLAELATLCADVSREQVVVITGPSGVGKTELAREFGRGAAARYPGGTWFVACGSGAAAVDLERIGAQHLALEVPDGLSLDERAERTLIALSAAPTLLIYDNPSTAAAIAAWLPASGVARHVLVTSFDEQLLPDAPSVRVPPLAASEARQVVDLIATGAGGEEIRQRLVAEAGGLAMQLIPGSRALKRELARGRDGAAALTLANETASSFELAYGSLDVDGRVIAEAASRMAIDRFAASELAGVVADALEWPDVRVSAALDRCVDLHIIEGVSELRMHQLLAAFIRSRTADDQAFDDAITTLRSAQWSRYRAAAGVIAESPTNTEAIVALLSSPVDLAAWPEPVAADDAHQVGEALRELGRYDDARPWYERAVTEKQQGDIHGRINHASLGTSIHQVGDCYSQTGRYDDARPWYERAVTEAEQGDIHGRINHESLGTSIHCVGDCYSQTGRYDDARPWYERAVTEKQQGDIHGRVAEASVELSRRALASLPDGDGSR